MTAWAVNAELDNPVRPLPVVCVAAIALYLAKGFDLFTVVNSLCYSNGLCPIGIMPHKIV